MDGGVWSFTCFAMMVTSPAITSSKRSSVSVLVNSTLSDFSSMGHNPIDFD